MRHFALLFSERQSEFSLHPSFPLQSTLPGSMLLLVGAKHTPTPRPPPEEEEVVVDTMMGEGLTPQCRDLKQQQHNKIFFIDYIFSVLDL